jgi:thioredoxin-related protein
MKDRTENFDRILNLLSLALLVAVAVTLALRAPTQSRTTSEGHPKAGTTMTVPGVDWAKNHRTVLLFLSSECAFCERSSTFHSALAKNISGTVHAISLFPPSTDTDKSARRYLEVHSIAISDVRVMSMRNFDVPGTPSIALVDDEGTVVHSWNGVLDPDAERSVMSLLADHTSWAEKATATVKSFLRLR